MWVMESGMDIGKAWVLGMAGGVWGLCSFGKDGGLVMNVTFSIHVASTPAGVSKCNIYLFQAMVSPRVRH